MKNYDLAVRLYERGSSIQALADRWNITRQAMWSALKVRNVKFRPQKRTGKDNHFYRGGKTANAQTNDIFERALESGKIIKKDSCENCGATGKFKDGRSAIQAHHSDYNKPLDVMWLCQRCHHEWHKNNKAIERREDATR